MASYMIHMYIGEQYAKKNGITDTEFFKGCLAPDFVKDKTLSHYRKNIKTARYTERLKDKADLRAFCENNKIDSLFKKGEFLHLYVDHEFYAEYLYNLKTIKQLDKMNIEDAMRELSDEYNRINSLFVNDLKVEHLDLIPDECELVKNQEFRLCTKKGLIDLFNKCINVNLEELYKQNSTK